jgi:citrate lyase subunit beta/citryl-CoA lyase
MLTPTESELRWARQVVAIASRESVTVVEGQMVDKPVIERAQRLLSRQHVGTRSVEQ